MTQKSTDFFARLPIFHPYSCLLELEIIQEPGRVSKLFSVSNIAVDMDNFYNLRYDGTLEHCMEHIWPKNGMAENSQKLQDAEAFANYTWEEDVQTTYISLTQYMLGHPEVPKHELAALLFIKGSALDNGKTNARAGCGVYWGSANSHLNISIPLDSSLRQTNNCAEIWAATHAVQSAKNEGYGRVLLVTNSDLLYQCVEKGKMYEWSGNNWEIKSGDVAANKEELKILLKVLTNYRVNALYVPDDGRIYGIEKARYLARAGAMKSVKTFIRATIGSPPGPGKH